MSTILEGVDITAEPTVSGYSQRSEYQYRSIRGTQTEQNLLIAFAEESQARNQYTIFARQAQQQGYEQIGAIFLATAENERHHAKIYWNYLSGGIVKITGSFHAGRTGSTIENLKLASDAEQNEWDNLYPHFGNIAREEEFEDIAETFYQIANIERTHLSRFQTVLKRLETGTEFRRDTAVDWVCRVCGHIHLGLEAPETCPVCHHPRAFFEVQEPV